MADPILPPDIQALLKQEAREVLPQMAQLDAIERSLMLRLAAASVPSPELPTPPNVDAPNVAPPKVQPKLNPPAADTGAEAALPGAEPSVPGLSSSVLSGAARAPWIVGTVLASGVSGMIGYNAGQQSRDEASSQTVTTPSPQVVVSDASVDVTLDVAPEVSVDAPVDIMFAEPRIRNVRSEVPASPIVLPSQAPAVSEPVVEPAVPSTGGTLLIEQSLISRSRLALARRQPESALQALREHASRFPQGSLSEERDALMVVALASSGDLSNARSRAARFLATYPQSPLRRVVEDATRAR